jgi:hypothetical protein
LNGATPDQAAKEIVTLRDRLADTTKRLDSVFPKTMRTLPDTAKKYVISKKDDLLKFGQPILVYAWAIGDSLNYAEEFWLFLEACTYQL